MSVFLPDPADERECSDCGELEDDCRCEECEWCGVLVVDPFNPARPKCDACEEHGPPCKQCEKYFDNDERLLEMCEDCEEAT